MTVIRSAISCTSFSLWLMKTTDLPCGLQVRMIAEKLVGLAGGEHGGRLVEDEHARLAVQRLDDLDALLDADGEVLDEGVGVDGKAVAARELAALLARACGGRASRARSCAPRRA